MSVKIISQIFLTDSPDPELSPFLKHATGTVRSAFPDHGYTIYNKQTLRQFIVDNYDAKVVWAYDKLRPYAYKADLGRHCLLNKLGGWYFDIGVRVHSGIKINDTTQFLAFRDIQRNSRTSWACSDGILYSKPENIVLQTAIKYIIRNCEEEYYGITPLCPTGPTLLGEALAAHRGNVNFIFGDHLELTPRHENKNRGFVLPDGTIFAWGKPCEGGDLTELGALGVNNYNELWRNKQVYVEQGSGPGAGGLLPKSY